MDTILSVSVATATIQRFSQFGKQDNVSEAINRDIFVSDSESNIKA